MRTLILAILGAFIFYVHGLGTADVTSCRDSTCNQQCIALHWNGGYCKDDQCWCWKYGESARWEESPSAELKLIAPEVGECDTSSCQTECGGHCQDGKCLCRIPIVGGKNTWSLLNELPTNFRDTNGNDVTSCTLKSCLDACKEEGAIDGFCLQNLCWCSVRNETTTNTRNVRPVIELQAKVSDLVTNKNICHPSDCRRRCNNDNKTAGAACFYGYCWCDNEPRKIQEKQARKQLL